MLTNKQKTDILALIEDEVQRLGSARAVAKKCRVSETAISQLRKGSYAAEGDDIYNTVALALGYEFNAGSWSLAPDTTNYLIVNKVLTDAKAESMFMGIAHRAGSGKTATAEAFLARHRRGGAYMICCKEWSGRTFLQEVAREIGVELPKGYATVSALVDAVADAFKRVAHARPLLIVDQANSLKPSALRTFIYLFNACEDFLGVAILGTDNLEIEVKRGVRLNRTGYDEFDSRFGRKYIHLIGATLADTRKICAANGVTDAEAQKRIFEAAEPVRVTVEDGKSVAVVEDIRRIKRLVKSERIRRAA